MGLSKCEMGGLGAEEEGRYEWQMLVRGIGEEGQKKLKGSSVLVSRVGGIGGTVAYLLAAAGVGRLVLAHGGILKPSDLNRQLLMTTDWVGKPRIESAVRRLRELNPNVEIHGEGSNINEENVGRLVGMADIVVDAAPLFEERFLMNREAVRQGKPMVESSMYEMEAQVTTIFPGETPCLQCLVPEKPEWWTRKFPVLGAISSVAASVAAVEVVKVLTGVGEPLAGRLLAMDLRAGRFRELSVRRDPECPVCGGVAGKTGGGA